MVVSNCSVALQRSVVEPLLVIIESLAFPTDFLLFVEDYGLDALVFETPSCRETRGPSSNDADWFRIMPSGWVSGGRECEECEEQDIERAHFVAHSFVGLN